MCIPRPTSKGSMGFPFALQHQTYLFVYQPVKWWTPPGGGVLVYILGVVSRLSLKTPTPFHTKKSNFLHPISDHHRHKITRVMLGPVQSIQNTYTCKQAAILLILKCDICEVNGCGSKPRRILKRLLSDSQSILREKPYPLSGLESGKIDAAFQTKLPQKA